MTTPAHQQPEYEQDTVAGYNGGGPSIESVIIRMKSYSLLVLPVGGFFVGQLLQLALGTRSNRQFESLMVHLITVILMVFISASILSSDNKAFQNGGDRIFCIGVSYLFVLGVVLGIISVLF